jgi:hypothetical protein
MHDHRTASDRKARIEHVLERAMWDTEFKRELTTNPRELLAKLEFSEEEIAALSTLKMRDLESLGLDVKSYRSILIRDGSKFALAGIK